MWLWIFVAPEKAPTTEIRMLWSRASPVLTVTSVPGNSLSSLQQTWKGDFGQDKHSHVQRCSLQGKAAWRMSRNSPNWFGKSKLGPIGKKELGTTSTLHYLGLSSIYDPLFSKYSLLLDLLENMGSLKDTLKNGNVIRTKWKRKAMAVREKGSNFHTCLRDLEEQISGKFKSLEALLVI